MAVTNTAALLAELQKEVDAGGGGGGALSGLSDVSMTAPATGEVLTYDGSAWVNQPAGGSATTITKGKLAARIAGAAWY